MFLRNSIICSLLLMFHVNVNAQILTNTFVDPCSKKVTVFVVPLQGTTIVFMGKAKFFTSTDVQTGVFSQWINQVYAEYAAPCPVNQLTQQLTQQTVSSSVSSAVSSAASSAAASAAASVSVPVGASASSPSSPSSSSGSDSKSDGGSGDNKSESKSEEKSSSKKEDKKDSKKEEKKKSNAKSAQTPLIFSSDLSSVKQLQGTFNLMANLGVSRASMAGDVSYGSTLTIFSNLKQFALSTRYSKMNISHGKLHGISTMSYTVAYNDGNLLHIMGNSYVMMHKSYIYGYALSLINTSIPFADAKQQFWTSSIVLFGMKPIAYSKRLGITPEVFIMSSPLSYTSKSDDLTASSQLSYIFGSSFDVSLSKRFKMSFNVKYMGPVHTIGLLVGTKFNL